MKKLILLVLLALGCVIGQAQESGFRVGGKIDGIADGTLLLVCGEADNTKTLGTTMLSNGAFVFTGKVERPMLAYVTPPDGQVFIPIILENAVFTINATKTGALIKGGPQQEIYSQFSKLNLALLQEQNRIQAEYRAAEQVRDVVKAQALQDQLASTLAAAQQQEKALLQKYADTYVAAHVVAVSMERMDESVLREKYDLLGEAAKATVPGQAIAKYLDECVTLAVGNIAPDFVMTPPTGDAIKLYGIRSKAKLIHFWDWMDADCLRLNVELLALYQKYHMKGLEIISIAEGEDCEEWVKTLVTDGMIWQHGLDKAQSVARLLHVRKVPYTILLDEENRIVAKGVLGKELQKKINELVKKK